MSNRSDPSTETDGSDGAARCPYCDSENTEIEHPKGPSLCRSIHFCNGCGQSFEALR